MLVTIDLADDIHRAVLQIARESRSTVNATVVRLLRQAVRTTDVSVDFRTGLPMVRLGTVVTSEDVRTLDDEW